MKFIEVAHIFEKIETTSSRLEMTQLLADLLSRASAHEARFLSYLSLGTLNPPYISTQFNLAKKSLIAVVARLLDEQISDIQKKMHKAGDLGALVVEGAWRGDELTVTQVYHALQRIEAISGTGSVESKIDALTQLLKQLEPVGAKYIIRIVLGTLRLGFSDMTVVDALSWMATGDKSLRTVLEDAYNRCADIGLIAYTLKEDGVDAIKAMHAQVGIPIRPAAAERLPTAKAIIEKIGPCIAQPKLDGFRIQVHLDKRGETPKIHFFSRNLLDMSQMFPDLTAAIAQFDVEDMIAEGEAIVFDPDTGTFLPFQQTVKRKRKHGIDEAVSDFPLKLYLFDLLYLNGHELLHQTHEKRRAQLLAVAKSYTGDTVHIIEEKKIETAKELEDYFVHNIAAGLEGLVVKKSDSIYRPGKRNFNWIKLKRQEEGHLEDTVDTVILGYYYGSGKRAKFGIGAFLVGVYNKHLDRFQTIAKVGTGLKDDEWIELKKICDQIAAPKSPSNVICPRELVPDVWTYPEKVCLIRADEITLSPVHTAGKTEHQLGYALRFPRFMGYRPDKSVTEATTVAEIKRLYQDQYNK